MMFNMFGSMSGPPRIEWPPATAPLWTYAPQEHVTPSQYVELLKTFLASRHHLSKGEAREMLGYIREARTLSMTVVPLEES